MSVNWSVYFVLREPFVVHNFPRWWDFFRLRGGGGSSFFTLSKKEIRCVVMATVNTLSQSEPGCMVSSGLTMLGLWAWLHAAHSVETGASLPVTDFPAVTLVPITHCADVFFNIICKRLHLFHFSTAPALFCPVHSKHWTDSKFRRMTCHLSCLLTLNALSPHRVNARKRALYPLCRWVVITVLCWWVASWTPTLMQCLW